MERAILSLIHLKIGVKLDPIPNTNVMLYAWHAIVGKNHIDPWDPKVVEQHITEFLPTVRQVMGQRMMWAAIQAIAPFVDDGTVLQLEQQATELTVPFKHMTKAEWLKAVIDMIEGS